MINKNDILDLEIIDITHECSGIAKHEGLAIFVPMTAKGDFARVKIIKVNKNFAFGRVEQLLTPSKAREENKCPVYKRCGGCSLRHITYKEELSIKQSWVKENLRRIGGFSEIETEEIIGSKQTDSYRNKVQYPLTYIDGKVVAGFYAKRTHEVIPSTKCMLQPISFEIITEEILDFINEKNLSCYDEKTHNGLLRHIYIRKGEITGEIMICLVATKTNIPYCDELVERLLKLKIDEKIVSVMININSEDTNVILGNKNKIIFGKDGITDIICDKVVDISCMAFYQVNHNSAQILYNKALEYMELKGNENVVELYCGAGTITLSIAPYVKEVIAVEIIPEAIKNAKINAQKNNITNIEFICDDAQGAAKELVARGVKPDIVVIDPPRRGCDNDVLAAISDMSPTKIVYISCNSATLARDCKELSGYGYKLIKIQPVDLFPRTGHIETICVLIKDD